MGECYICGEETDKGKKNFALGEWIYLCCRACDDEYDPYRAESFDADWDNAPYGSWDEAWSDEISFPMVEKPERLWLKNLSVIAVFAGAIWVGKQTRK